MQATVSSLQGEKQELARQEVVLRDRLKEFNDHETKVKRLERRVALLESQYHAHATSLEQARINQALAADKISSINILQPATFAAQPVAPRKQFVVLMGVLFGAFGALALALLAEYFDNTVKGESDVERHLALPVLLSLPRSSAARRIVR
jgi:uncharacterized protein involved in exopolysaccharide biosynthesis